MPITGLKRKFWTCQHSCSMCKTQSQHSKGNKEKPNWLTLKYTCVNMCQREHYKFAAINETSSSEKQTEHYCRMALNHNLWH